MNGLERTPITLEHRQAVWHDLERARFAPVQFTGYMFLQLLTMFCPGAFVASAIWGSTIGGLVRWGMWRYFPATIAVIAAELAGIVFGYWLFGWFDRLAAREVRRASDEKLWKKVDWGLRNQASFTLALAQLAARGRDLSGVLPRIIELLDSKSSVTRCIAFDGFRVVFLDELRAIKGYNPDASFEDCRAKVARLRELLAAEKASDSALTGQGGLAGNVEPAAE